VSELILAQEDAPQPIVPSALVQTLPRLLSDTTPSIDLISLLRNETFQDSLFLEVECDDQWPQVRLTRF
jgi:hypothetical protein